MEDAMTTPDRKPLPPAERQRLERLIDRLFDEIREEAKRLRETENEPTITP
jgi:hypothetical protein